MQYILEQTKEFEQYVTAERADFRDVLSGDQRLSGKRKSPGGNPQLLLTAVGNCGERFIWRGFTL